MGGACAYHGIIYADLIIRIELLFLCSLGIGVLHVWISGFALNFFSCLRLRLLIDFAFDQVFAEKSLHFVINFKFINH